MPIKYIGKTLPYQGKTLWEIVGNLKNFGVGRIVIRSIFKRYPEPSYYKIVKVETLPNPEIDTPDDMRKVRVFTERTFRGRKYSDLHVIEGTSYKTDYQLIPKDKETEYCKWDEQIVEKKILPKTMNFPPLLRELIIREAKARGEEIKGEPQLKVVYRQTIENHSRIAEENETPNIEVTCGFQKPVAPRLFDGLNL